jgi:hypothetical protein
MWAMATGTSGAIWAAARLQGDKSENRKNVNFSEEQRFCATKFCELTMHDETESAGEGTGHEVPWGWRRLLPGGSMAARRNGSGPTHENA